MIRSSGSAPIIWKVFVNLLEKRRSLRLSSCSAAYSAAAMRSMSWNSHLAAPSWTRPHWRACKVLPRHWTHVPGLELDVPNTYSTAVDTPALAQHQLQTLLRKRAGLADDAPLPTDDAALFKLLLAEYRGELGAKATLPPPDLNPEHRQEVQGRASGLRTRECRIDHRAAGTDQDR